MSRPSSDPRTRGVRHSIVEEYTRLAPDYDRRWSHYVEATVRETLNRLECTAGERVLDVGCGTGALLHRLLLRDPGVQFTGVDPVQAMLQVARRRLPESVFLCSGWAEALPFAEAAFDLVVSSNAFHYFRQPQPALAEIRRVLRPGGRLILTDWCDDYLACRVCDRWLRLTSRAYGKVYRSRKLHGLLVETGFRNVTVDRYKIGWYWGLMTARAT